MFHKRKKGLEIRIDSSLEFKAEEIIHVLATYMWLMNQQQQQHHQAIRHAESVGPASAF